MLKRLVDIGVTLPLLPLALPVVILLMLLVWVDSSGGALFRQVRIGRAGRPFTLYKLRSFHKRSHGIFPDEEIHWNDPRVTRVGGWLRRSKLDELPQLVNVLLGQMSLVGPRPDIPLQVERYGVVQLQRLAVRPGLTGLAQISGNTSLSWSQRIELDRWYVAHRSLRLDLAILAYTPLVMMRGERQTDDPFGVRALLATQG